MLKTRRLLMAKKPSKNTSRNFKNKNRTLSMSPNTQLVFQAIKEASKSKIF